MVLREDGTPMGDPYQKPAPQLNAMMQAEKEHLRALLLGLDDEDLTALAYHLWPKIEQNMLPGALERAQRSAVPRILSNGADIYLDSAGNDLWYQGGQSRFPIIDFIDGGGQPYIASRSNRNTVKIPRGAGGGTDCMMDFITSGCFAALAGFVEGTSYTSLSGCTFKGYSTWQGAATAISAQANGTNTVHFVCGGQYSENVTYTGPTQSTTTILGAGRDRVLLIGVNAVGCSLLHATSNTTAYVVKDLTINGHNSALSRCIGNDPTGSNWTLYNVKLVTGTNATSIGIDTGTVSVRWRLYDCQISSASGANGIGFTDGGGGDSSTLWGGVQLYNCNISTPIGARFVNDSAFYMQGGAMTGAIGIQNNSVFTSSEVYFDDVRFACATAAVQCSSSGGFTDAAWIGCRFVNCAKSFDWGTLTQVSKQVRIEGCNFSTNNGANLGIDDAARALRYAIILGNTFNGYNAGNEIVGFTVAQALTNNVQIVHNETDSGTPIVDTHANILTGTGGPVYSIARHVWMPDAAVGVTITAGNAQGDYKHSGPSGETATRLTVDAKTAPGAAGLPITVSYGDTDDLDTVASWTTIATVTLSSEKSTSQSSMTNAAVPASRLMRMDVGTIVGSPADANVELFTKVPVSA